MKAQTSIFTNMTRKLGLIMLSTLTVLGSGSAVGVTTSADYDAIPPTFASGSANTDPLVMLAMSNDHQLYVKAYTDYTDLDGNGTIDTTYIDTFDYYGYFDSNRCYSHAAGKFTPEESASGANNHHCPTANRWSGNFLNWTTMTRMDVIRKVLFGGARSTDTTTATILERVLIPTDVHAFVKTYTTATNAEMQLYTPYSQTEISMCNVTRGSGASETATEPPLLRVARGLWPGWSSNERTQCLYRNENSGGLGIEPPDSTDTNVNLDELIVRVDVCVAGKLESNCKQYTSGSPKPTGILQKFGDRSITPIRFGLMTGSYAKNMSGGVLRKDINTLADEINSTTGQFINQTSSDRGIINTISRFRISRYNFNSPYTYTDCNSPGIATINEGNASTGCSAWGNPIGEIYMEALRYFSGQTSPSTAFNASDSSYISSLPQINTWTDPLSNTNYCANCSIVVISTGLNSFDTDQMSSASDIEGIANANAVDALTDTVGNSSNENINGNSYIIGESGASTNQQCTSKTVANFSDAEGICPELPTLKGGFQIAGLAHHAFTTDLRTDNVTYPDIQNVDTYSISLAESLPSFSIPVDGKTVTFTPHCESNSSGSAAIADSGWRICSLADVTIESLAADQSTGSMLFSWEDSTWGFDYDMDGVERITWCVGSACTPAIANDQIKFTASAEATAAGFALLFGYTLSGTTSDGVKRHVLRPGGQNFNQLYPPFNNAGNQPADVTATYTASGNAAALFKNPLWYAAKYGSFTDSNNNQVPDLTQEWDSKNNRDGSFNPDGIPDNFFQVTNPALLEAQLEKVFTKILQRTSAGTALAVLSTDTSSISSIYQALYDPLVQTGNNSITWGGRVHSLFIDDKGHIREDSNLNDRLDDYATDKIIDLFYDPVAKRTLVRRFTSTDNGVTRGTAAAPEELSTLKTIWNARDELSLLDAATITNQRPYANTISSSSNSGRHIFTWVDADIDGIIDDNEVVDFTSSTFDTDTFGFLNVTTETAADNIVDFIRGKEGISGFRSRTIDFDSSRAGDEAWLLGDVIHSTPVIVGRPGSAYDLLHGDNTYQNFVNTYKDRRQVLYVGANDGMLHAFNAGFYDRANKEFDLTDSNGATSHPLGSELWAYVPFNLLPHLKWLTETDYPHVYYMDGEPRVFDVNIFPAGVDATTGINHPNGWGTILVVGMRFGGGNLTYDHDNDGGASTADITTRSAYVVLDITDPERKPTLLAEITAPNLNFTTSVPSLAVKRVPGLGVDWANPATNKWYLVFGSGPTDLDTVTSNQNAQVYVYDLNTRQFHTDSPLTLSGATNSFVGNPKAADWNNDFTDDIVYFGSVGGTNAAPTGMLHRLVMGTTLSANTLLNPGQPFVSAPTTTLDNNNRQWIYAGTGRLFAPEDNSSTTQQSYYGIKEPLTSGIPAYTNTVTVSDLQNVTTIQVFADQSVVDPSPALLPSGTDTYSELVDVINGADGWYRNFATGSNPSERNLSSSLLSRQLLLFTAYTPPLNNACIAEGSSDLFALSFLTGTALPGLGLGTDTSILNNTAPVTVTSLSIGDGLASGPTIIPGGGGGGGGGSGGGGGGGSGGGGGGGTPPCPAGTISVAVQDSTGQIVNRCVAPPSLTAGRQSWRELSF